MNLQIQQPRRGGQGKRTSCVGGEAGPLPYEPARTRVAVAVAASGLHSGGGRGRSIDLISLLALLVLEDGRCLRLALMV